MFEIFMFAGEQYSNKLRGMPAAGAMWVAGWLGGAHLIKY